MNNLNRLNGWVNTANYCARRSARSFIEEKQSAFVTSGCGSSCGTTDNYKPASGCGADDTHPTPSGCGASDDCQRKTTVRGTGCGA